MDKSRNPLRRMWIVFGLVAVPVGWYICLKRAEGVIEEYRAKVAEEIARIRQSR